MGEVITTPAATAGLPEDSALDILGWLWQEGRMGRFDEGFEGCVALVTGGGSGIGRATAERLTGAGARVVLADLDESGGKQAAKALGTDFVTLDVGDPDAWREVVSNIDRSHGALHLAHLNAGIMTYRASGEELARPFELGDLPDENYRRLMATNLDGVVFGMRATAPLIERSGGGAIVATASTAGVVPFAMDPIYTASKHAVVGFVRSMAPWLVARGIACHAVLPGVVDTNILAEGFADKAREIGIPVIAPDQIADAVVHAARHQTTGGLWICVAGKAPYAYEFEPVRGLGVPAKSNGERA
jgi:NAD(P)-dependent dehydrogenase (short-subunit alcohol dehydrogenase family)